MKEPLSRLRNRHTDITSMT